MKLQVNNSGAWKQVLTFSIEDIERVKAAAAELAKISAAADERPICWRMVDAMDRVVLMTDKQCAWFTPRWMLGFEIVP